MKLQRLTEDQIQSTLTNAVKEAVSFVESEIAPDRIKAQRYFDGECYLGYEDGRSKVVATKCRDTVRAVKPSLMRVFLQSGKPVEFIPRNQQAVAGAEQATKYAQFIFERNNGFDRLHDAVHDALIKKVGILKVYFDETQEVEVDEYSGLTEDQVALIKQDPEIEIIEEEIEVEAVMDEMGMIVQPPIYELKVARTSRQGAIKIDSVAPEDFFVDRGAVSIDDCYVCGHSTEGRVGDLVEMGFDFDEVFDLGGGESRVDEEEELARTGWDDADADEDANDPSMRKVLITEAFMRMDIDGTGVPRLYKFLCGGADYKVLDYELADINPFAVFEIDPEPHTFFGRSLVDIILDDQDAATSLLRGLLDNIALMNNPGMVINENAVNMDDVLNNEIGRIIRAKDVNALREVVVGSAAQAALPAMQFYDESIRTKTGVSGAGMGLDADMLQGQTATGVNAAVQAANQVSELMARVLAEGGMKRLFKNIVALARQHPNADEMMRIDGQFVPVDPRSWKTGLDVITNVGLGTDHHDQKAMALRETLQNQMSIWQAYGPTNGLVTMTGIRATLTDILAMAGINNADRYYAPMNPQIEQMLLMQAQQAQQAMSQQGAGSDPNAAYLQAEQMKMSARVQADMAKTQLDAHKLHMEDDRQRDKMAQDLAIKAAELLAKTGVQIDQNSIKREQAMPRDMSGGYNV